MPRFCRVAGSARGSPEGGSALMERFGRGLRRRSGLSSRIPRRLRPREDPPRASPRGRSLQSDSRWESRCGPQARTLPQGLTLGIPLARRERVPPFTPLSGGEKGLRRRAVRPGLRSASAATGRAPSAQLRARSAWLRPRRPDRTSGCTAVPAAGHAVNPPSSRSRPGHGRVAGAPPPQSREPAGWRRRRRRRVGPAGRLAPAPLLASPAAACSHGRRAGPPLPLSPADALSGRGVRTSHKVSVLGAAGEAEYGSRPQSPRARQQARPDSARCARPRSCALMRGRGGPARMRAARPPPLSVPGAGALPFGRGGERSGWPATVRCGLEQAREKTDTIEAWLTK